MAQKLLDFAEIRAHVQQMGRVAVAEAVRMDPVGDIRVAGEAQEDPPHVSRSESPRLLAAARPQRDECRDLRIPTGTEMRCDRLVRSRRERHHPLAPAFPENPDSTAVDVDRAAVQAAQLGDAEARTIEQFDDRVISQRSRRVLVGARTRALRRSVRQRMAVVHREWARQAAGLSRPGNPQARVGTANALADQVREEAAEARKLAADRRGREPAMAIREKRPHLVRTHGRGLGGRTQESGELTQIRRVRAARVLREATLSAEVPVEAFDLVLERNRDLELGGIAGAPTHGLTSAAQGSSAACARAANCSCFSRFRILRPVRGSGGKSPKFTFIG